MVTPRRRAFPQNHSATEKERSILLGPQGLLQCSQQSSGGPQHESVEFRSYTRILYLKFILILSSQLICLSQSYALHIFPAKSCIHFTTSCKSYGTHSSYLPSLYHPNNKRCTMQKMMLAVKQFSSAFFCFLSPLAPRILLGVFTIIHTPHVSHLLPHNGCKRNL